MSKGTHAYWKEWTLAMSSISRRAGLAARATACLLLLLLTPARVLAQDPAVTPEEAVYVVRAGDTLYSIAQRFETTVEAIAAANGLEDTSLIHVGQRLVIPTNPPAPVPKPQPEAEPDTRLHPVRPGETLPALAFRYGTSVWLLARVNELDRWDLLWPGQLLSIPRPTAGHAGVPRQPSIVASPMPVTQGQTMVIKVEGEGDLQLSGWFMGEELAFAVEGGWYWALLGLDPLTPTGAYPLALQAVQAGSGDQLTMQETLTVTAGTFSTLRLAIPADRQSLLDPALAEAERKKVDAVFAQVSPTRLWAGTFALPLAGEPRTTSPFGQLRSYGNGPPSSYHSGHDFGADTGTPVMAPITGTVALAEPLQVRGQVIILDHGLGVLTGYWHLSQIDVAVGQLVGKGQVIGLVGNTGLSTGPHLHWELRVHEVPVDPLQWTRRSFP
jgi:murein DD-endopeptidase MepM/ murein hydrolase activator NlpD